MILTHGANSLNRGGGNTVNIGGMVYPTVTIGNQIWLAENLDYKFAGCGIGSSIRVQSTPHAWYYDNDEATYGVSGYKCGLLYNWYAAKYLDDNKLTLLPVGWRVPSSTDWLALFNAVGGSANAATKLKSLDKDWFSNWNGIDEYGFDLMPCGDLESNFSYFGSRTMLWASDEWPGWDAGAWFTEAEYDRTSMLDNDGHYKYLGMSVRLCKDTDAT